MTKKPIISIVTVAYNAVESIEDTIKSVLAQTYKNIEYIIIDGGSTDGTLDIIKKYESKISFFMSEQDNGIYDAMNKSVKVCTGDFVNFLNADDVICNEDSIENIIKYINDFDSVYYSRAMVESDNISWIYPALDVVDYKKWLRLNLPNHQTMFFPKSFYKNFKYDVRLKIGADDDYKLFAIENKNVEFANVEYVEFRRGGVSSNHKSFSLFRQRIKESYIRNFKHKRWIRLIIDPLKLIFMFLINSILGEDNFLKFIKMVVKLKG
jgi:putative colanic acid biosynthesis glycosyltransferase